MRPPWSRSCSSSTTVCDADPASGRRYSIFTNQVGAPVRVEDDHGAVVWSAEISPYGQARVAEGSRIDLSLRFPGHYHDPELDLHYNRFRYYSPELGRYIQSDPLGIAGGINLYAYAPSQQRRSTLMAWCPVIQRPKLRTSETHRKRIRRT